ncbi:hypothetical protein [Streptomyces sp. NPDC014995]|uniref:hypothetical protein n=1 Tax=Streptomyces sp. NPDC014995 TaxID=3364936 RepID=UPI0036FF2BC4
MSDAAAATATPGRGSYRHVTSVAPLSDVDLTLMLGANSSVMASVLESLRLMRTALLQHYTGTGKTRAAGEALHVVLVVDDLRTALDEAQEHWDAVEFTRSLLRSAEEATRVPSITAPTADSTPVWMAGPLPTLDELVDAAEAAGRFQLLAVELLHAVLGAGRHGFRSPAPPHESSPCGVIRLAAPLVPRAPGGPAASPFSSNSCVLAA